MNKESEEDLIKGKIMNKKQLFEARAIALRLYLHATKTKIGYKMAAAILGMKWPNERFELNKILGEIVELDAKAGITKQSGLACRWVVIQNKHLKNNPKKPGKGFIAKANDEGVIQP